MRRNAVEVARTAQPPLWNLVDAVAADLGQPAPDRMRLALRGDPAAVECPARPGAVSSRVLLLPLAHLAGLSTVELRAAVAHELGPLPAGPPARSRRRWPGSTRRRAAAADALAARIYGREPAARALGRRRSLAVGFDAYWTQDVEPLLRAGLRPPVCAGFALYLAAPAVRAELALEAAPPGAAPAPAFGLVVDLDGLELALLHDAADRPGPTLRPVDWRDGPARALPDVWAARARWLADRELRAGEVADELRATVERQPGDQIAADDALLLFGSALSRALARDGWSVVKPPGTPCTLAKGDSVVVPGDELAAVARGEVSPAAWTERCRRLGIADLALSDAPAA